MAIYDENPVLRILSGFDDITIDRFYDRLRLQKLTYLIQEISGNNSFAYSWYIRGPYSSSLASILFMGDDVGAFEEKFRLNNTEQEIVNKIQDLVDGRTNNAEYLELIASVWYLMPNSANVSDKKSLILDVMKSEKPQFTPEEVDDAISRIQEFKKKYNLFN